jgi:uncharacterized OB-fold protein
LAREPDPFEDFREVMLVELRHQFSYQHSLGKSSKFFLGLARAELWATRCERCEAVFMPPRAVCAHDLSVTYWQQLSGNGVLESWTLCPYPPAYAVTESPYILAYVRLDGTDSLFLHQLRQVKEEDLYHGLAVSAVFADTAHKHPLDMMWFEVKADD